MRIAITLWVSWQLEGGAAAVNEAGRMRGPATSRSRSPPRTRVPCRLCGAIRDGASSSLRQCGAPPACAMGRGRPRGLRWSSATGRSFAGTEFRPVSRWTRCARIRYVRRPHRRTCRCHSIPHVALDRAPALAAGCHDDARCHRHCGASLRGLCWFVVGVRSRPQDASRAELARACAYHERRVRYAGERVQWHRPST